MSHFVVAVFTDSDTDVDSLLEPYYEGLRVPAYLYLTKEEIIKTERNSLEDYKESVYAEYLRDPEAYLANHCQSNRNHPHFVYVSTFMDRYNETDEEILRREYKGYAPEMIDEEGNVYSTYNPKSKWDWYVTGGRFSNFLISKSTGEHEDVLPVSDVDFTAMSKAGQESLSPYEDMISGGFYKPEYLKRLYPTQEVYEKISTSFWTRAVVTPDGKWHELGEMGWFGMSSEEPEDTLKWVEAYYDRFIKPALENNWCINIIDCHI